LFGDGPKEIAVVDKERLVELAERLKATVHLARTYASGTGSIFETAMLEAERLADRTLLDLSTPEMKDEDDD
jgi:hypothetical protein